MEPQALPVELLDGIFTQLYDGDPSNLLPLTLVSRGVYMLVMPLLYRSITINIARKGLSECIENVYETLVERLLAGPSVCALVKEICVVHKSDICSYRRSDNSELLLRLIPRLPRLESLRWEAKGDFPIELLKSLLQYGPKSNFRLCLDIGPVKGNQSLSTYNSLLDQVCHTLLSLRICIPCGFEYPEEPRRVKSKLFSALKGFSKLRSLSIYGEYEYSSVYSYVSDGPRLAVKPAETLPQLRELSVTDGSDTFQWEDLEVWGANGRWSHLQKVTFRDPQLLNGIHGCEKTLISLSLIEVSEGFEKPLADICSRLDRLRELGVGGKNFHVPVAALQKCGHSLKSLVMRNQDMYGRESAKEGSLQALQSIHDSCPMLSSIAMSINRQPVEWEFLSKLAQLSHLTELSLYSEKHPGHRRVGLLPDDKIGMEYVEKAFRYLIKHSRGQQFKSLRFYYGPTRDWDIPEAYHKPRSIFHATSTARDGQEREISVRHINDKEVRNSHSPSTSYDSRQAEQEDIDDYMNSMPPAILSRMISALGVQADETSLEVPDPGYDVRTGGLQSELGTYEADWKASHGILPLLKRQLQKRKEEGWDLWEMPLMEGKGGKASFLYDRLRAG